MESLSFLCSFLFVIVQYRPPHEGLAAQEVLSTELYLQPLAASMSFVHRLCCPPRLLLYILQSFPFQDCCISWQHDYNILSFSPFQEVVFWPLAVLISTHSSCVHFKSFNVLMILRKNCPTVTSVDSNWANQDLNDFWVLLFLVLLLLLLLLNDYILSDQLTLCVFCYLDKNVSQSTTKISAYNCNNLNYDI